MESNITVRVDIQKISEKTVRDLRYIVDCTKFDITYIVNQLARYVRNTTDRHWNALKQLFGFQKNTNMHALHYLLQETYTKLTTFADENVTDDKETCK